MRAIHKRVLLYVVCCFFCFACAEKIDVPEKTETDPAEGSPGDMPGMPAETTPGTTPGETIPKETPAKTFSMLSTDPDSALGGIPIDSSLTVEFSMPVDRSTLTSNTFWLHDMSAHKKVVTEIEYDAAKRAATLIPEGLSYDNHYLLIAHRSIESTTGLPLEQTYERSFFTEVQPQIFKQDPPNGALDVNIKSVVVVGFNNPMDLASITNDTFYLEDSLGVKVSATIEATDKEAILKPVTELKINTEYFAVLTTAVKEKSGNPLSLFNIRWRFATAASNNATQHLATVGDDSINTMAIDSKNNMLIAGITSDTLEGQVSAGMEDAFLAKYDANHSLLWIKQFGTKAYDTATDVTVDDQDNIYVLGYSDGSIDGATIPAMSDIYVAKYDPDGKQLWLVQLGSMDESDLSQSILFSNNKLYISGTTNGMFEGQASKGEKDFFLGQLSPLNGVVDWIMQDGTAGLDQVKSIGKDSKNNIIVATEVADFDPVQKKIAPRSYLKIHAYDQSQKLSWVVSIKEPTTHYELSDMTIAESKILLSGISIKDPSLTPSPGKELSGIYLTSLDAAKNGETMWSKTITPEEAISINSVAADSTGNIYFAAYSTKGINPALPIINTVVDEALYILKIDRNGAAVQWRSGIAANNFVAVTGMDVDATGMLHIAGSTRASLAGNILQGEQDGFIAKVLAETGVVQ